MITQTHAGETYDETTITMPLGFTIQTKYRDLFKKVALISFPDGHVLATGDKENFRHGIYAQEFFSFHVQDGHSEREYAVAQRPNYDHDFEVTRRFIIR